MEKEKELEGLLKDLANHKVQVEAKEPAYKQALLKLDHYQTPADEFSTLLKNSEFEKDIYIDECRVATTKIDELELKMEEMTTQLSETKKIRERFLNVITELRATQGELLSAETELAAARESKHEAMMQTELMETELQMEKLKTEELLRHVSELNETILHLNMAAIEAEKEKYRVLSEKQTELEFTTASAVNAQKQLENTRQQLEAMQDLENQLMTKSVFIDSLQLQIQQAKTVSDAIMDLNQLKLDLEMQEKKNSDQAVYIEALEIELNQLKLELENANEEVSRLNCSVERMKFELEEIKGRDTEAAEIEIAILKSELHRGRSKIAAAEVAEARARSEKSGLYLAVQQLAMEAEAAKKEKRELKLQQNYETKTEDENGRDGLNTHITISMEEYEALMQKAEKADQVPEPVPDNSYELGILMRELETATVRIGELRIRAEQAVSRAEVAEKGRAALEDQVRKWRERRERRKAAIAALQEESIQRESPKESSSFKYENVPTPYQPLGKVLNMEF